MQYTTPIRPKDHAEHALLAAILDGTYGPGSSLPGERSLAIQLGVTRPTLRETIQRLERDGWLTVNQGKSTTINNYWEEGGLNVLGTLVEHSDQLPPNFICQLLEVRLQLAPAYTAQAIAAHSQEVATFLERATALTDDPQTFAEFDWLLHRRLTIWSGNPIYTLILNGFAGFYEAVAARYFDPDENRAASREYYAALRDLASNENWVESTTLTRATMQQSITLWEHQQGASCGGMGEG